LKTINETHKHPSNKNRTNKTSQIEEPIKTYTQQLDLGAQKTHKKIRYCKLHHFFYSLVVLRASSPAVLSVCHPAKIFFTPKFSYLLFWQLLW
jgi:hypothetical protein